MPITNDDVCVYVYMCAYVCVYVYVYVCMYVCVYLYFHNYNNIFEQQYNKNNEFLKLMSSL